MKNLIELLNDNEKNEFLEYKKYKKNEIIFSEGLKCNYIGIIIEGSVLISTITYNNKEETINLLNKNKVFGNNLIFSSSPFYLGNVISYTNTYICFINKDNLMKLLNTNKLFLNEYLRILSDQVLFEKNNNKILVHKNVRDRILYYINITHKTKGQVKIKSIAELARILSLPRPSVSREIYKLINENIIKYNNKIITLI